jgi:hypothetical protein
VLPARRPFPPGGPTCDRWHTTLPVSSPLIQQLISGPDDTPAHTGPPVMHARDLAQKKKAADQVHLNPGEDTAAATRLPLPSRRVTDFVGPVCQPRVCWRSGTRSVPGKETPRLFWRCEHDSPKPSPLQWGSDKQTGASIFLQKHLSLSLPHFSLSFPLARGSELLRKNRTPEKP